MTSDPAVLNAMREGKTKKFLGAVSAKYKDYQSPCHSGVCQLFDAFRPHVLVFTHLCIPIARFVLDKYPEVRLCMAALYPRTPTRYTLPLFFNSPERNLPFGLTKLVHQIVLRKMFASSLGADGQRLRKQYGLKKLNSNHFWELFFRFSTDFAN
mmetsp:Transcript_87657/g.249376  ORF Transcript_87657/g.249376 Transcript_87657/m.249376 type:complete len:154 (+) Transcript_87657:546-1007(+)